LRLNLPQILLALGIGPLKFERRRGEPNQSPLAQERILTGLRNFNPGGYSRGFEVTLGKGGFPSKPMGGIRGGKSPIYLFPLKKGEGPPLGGNTHKHTRDEWHPTRRGGVSIKPRGTPT